MRGGKRPGGNTEDMNQIPLGGSKLTYQAEVCALWLVQVSWEVTFNGCARFADDASKTVRR